jgi:hypothetical protein
MSAASVVAYILGEGLIDAAHTEVRKEPMEPPIYEGEDEEE